MAGSLLVVNCGSSSLKLAVYDQDLKPQAALLAERLNSPSAQASARLPRKAAIELRENSDHGQALSCCIQWLEQEAILTEPPFAIGHRVVHGGEHFSDSTIIDSKTLSAIDSCSELAPLHNPVNLVGIRAMQAIYADVPQVAVFDTAFHQSLPQKAYLYAVPRRWYDNWGVRRYGFHGTSHACMLERLSTWLDKPASKTSLISAHLGNGCSITAISNGQSVDTSMGLTPLEGLVMGTRSGDIDPGLFDFLEGKGLSAQAIHNALNRESGLLGLSERTNDMRSLEQAAREGDSLSEAAVEVFCHRLARYIGAMMVSLEHCDGLVFTGGIGENSVTVREKTIAQLQMLGFSLDEQQNREKSDEPVHAIHEASSRPIYVIPTDEEGMIAADARRLATSASS